MQEQNKSIKAVAVLRCKSEEWIPAQDTVAVEEPLEIRMSYGKLQERTMQSISVTMRTPGHDTELALGFLFTENIIHSPDDVMAVSHVTHARTRESRENIMHVLLKESTSVDIDKLKRNFYTTSSCGVCGKESIDAVKLICPDPSHKKLHVRREIVLGLSETVAREQEVFSSTGGIHAAAIFDTNGRLLLLREDVGRHNALDKLIGAALFSREQERIDLTETILFLSGRASFELMQKAAMAGIPVVCAVGAPSSLAVEMAEESGITLIGFLREDRFNIYCHKDRILINK